MSFIIKKLITITCSEKDLLSIGTEKNAFLMNTILQLILKNGWSTGKKEEQYADLIHKEYWGALYLELSNLSWKDCPLTTSEKEERIKELMSDSKVHLAVSEYSLEEESNAFVKLLINLLRKERYLSALRVMHLRVVMGKKFQTSFKWIKEKFS